VSPPDWNPPTLPLPQTVAALVPERPLGQDNLGLWLDRFIRRDPTTWDLNSRFDARKQQVVAGGRIEQLGALAHAWYQPAVNAVLERRGFVTSKAAEPTASEVAGGRWAARAVMKQAGPLVIDYGRASTSESGLGMDWVLGAPKLAGSALRGAARAQAEDSEVVELFGQLEQAGGLSFYDALPDGGQFTLSVDVLTPHNKAYYEGRSPPGDWLSPSPTTFLVVVKTRFVVDVEGATEAQAKRGMQLLVAAMQNNGVGAKTRAGYGWFDPA
jgi:hypothetical protein